ncbi:MAG: M48 family metalloprotease, partial [Planctomycetota bacterium]
MEKGDVLGWLIALVAFPILVYLPALLYVARRAARDGLRTDFALNRAIQRTGWVHFLGCGLFFLFVVDSRDTLGPVVTSALLYFVPVWWLVAGVLGSTRLELTARGLRTGLHRFVRFNLFTAFLMGGQALPFLSAAFAAPVDITRREEILPGLALHTVIAICLGLALRHLIVQRMMKIRPFPDAAIEARLREVAARAKVRFRALRLVRHERGQAVNAVAATSSGTIYVAEGLVRGLDREELTAVLLHEVGHFGQPVATRLRNLGSLGVPVAIWLLRARSWVWPEHGDRFALHVAAGIVLGGLLLYWITHR